MRITPPEPHFRVVTPLPIAMREGALIDDRLRLGGLPFSWRTRIACWEPGDLSVDKPLRGPYRLWVHTHRFSDVPGGTAISDESATRSVLRRARPAFGPCELRRIFRYRNEAIPRILLGPAWGLSSIDPAATPDGAGTRECARPHVDD